MFTARRVATLLFVTASVVGLVACGGQSSSNNTTGAAASNAPIVIGVTSEKTGPVPVLGAEAIGYAAAAKYINQHGGILGRKVKLVVHDNAGDASRAVSDLLAFHSQGINLVLGGAFGGDCQAEAPVAASLAMVAICGSTDNLDPAAPTNMFGVGPGYSPTIANTTSIISRYAKKAAVFADRDASGNDSATIGPADLKTHGVTPILIRTDPTATSLKASIQQAMSKGAQVIWFSECTPAVIQGVSEAQQLGFKGKIMLENCLASFDVAKALKGLAGTNKQLIIQVPQLLLNHTASDPQEASAIALFKQTVPGQPNVVVAAGWDSMWVLKNAIEKAGSTDTAKVIAALNNNFHYTGVWQSGTYTSHDHRAAVTTGYTDPAYFTNSGGFGVL